MTQAVETWFQTAYIKGATAKLQSQGHLLKGMTRAPSRIVGKEAIFRVAGRGKAVEMSRTWEKAAPMNAGRDTVSLTFKDYQAVDVVRHPDINKMDIDEQSDIQKTAAYALGRKFDDLHFEEFDALALPAAQVIGDGTTAIGLLDPMAARARIAAKGINGDASMYCPLPSSAWNKMLIYKQFSESTWSGEATSPLAAGVQKRKWNGVTYFEAPDELFTFNTGRGETASTGATWFQTYMWLKDAVGFRTTYGMKSHISWENQYTGYFCNNWMDAGVKTILPDAVVRLKFKFEDPTVLPA